MDMSLKYFALCTSAQEVQNYRLVATPFQLGDWIDKGIISDAFHQKSIALEMVYVETPNGVKGFNYGEVNLLPTIEQLMRLSGQVINVEPTITEGQYSTFWNAPDNKKYKQKNFFASDEQLWLAYFMAKKHKKYWNV